jgi:hypothetical protein
MIVAAAVFMLREIMIALAIALAFGGTMPATNVFARGGGGHNGVGQFGMRARRRRHLRRFRGRQISAPFAGN